MDINKDELLSKAKEELKKEVSTISFETWIKPLNIQSINGNKIVFTAISEFQKDFIENRYSELILNTLKFITNKEWTFTVIDLSKATENTSTVEDFSKNQNPNISNAEFTSNRATLNPKYTFETFVVGNNNRFAHAASLAVADKPAQAYNPLFLYGGVGLGKTHLMHAIGNKVIEDNRNFNILYVTSEKFNKR